MFASTRALACIPVCLNGFVICWCIPKFLVDFGQFSKTNFKTGLDIGNDIVTLFRTIGSDNNNIN